MLIVLRGRGFHRTPELELSSFLTMRMKKVLTFTTVIVVILLLRTGWVFYSRWSEGKEQQRRKVEQERKEARQVVERMGGDRLSILQLTVAPAEVSRGETASLCYGVSNAKTVRIEPPVGEVWPSMSRCIDVTAKKDTVYRLTAEDGMGHTETATVPLKVK